MRPKKELSFICNWSRWANVLWGSSHLVIPDLVGFLSTVRSCSLKCSHLKGDTLPTFGGISYWNVLLYIPQKDGYLRIFTHSDIRGHTRIRIYSYISISQWNKSSRDREILFKAPDYFIHWFNVFKQPYRGWQITLLGYFVTVWRAFRPNCFKIIFLLVQLYHFELL